MDEKKVNIDSIIPFLFLSGVAFCVVTRKKFLPQSLEFIEWLNNNHRGYTLNQGTSQKEVFSLVNQFCQDLHYTNFSEFSKEIISWLSPTLAHKITDALLTEIIPESRKNSINPDFSEFIQRHKNIRFHGVFLFGENDNFSDFIKNHGRDLHDLTDDYIDIHYSKDDLNNRMTGYKNRKQFRSLDVEMSGIPAFVIWETSLTNNRSIFLEGLSHHQIFDVIKHIASAIEQKKSLDELASIGRDRVELFRDHSRPIYNIGQVGAVGPNARSDNNTFTQNIQNTDNTENLS